ncbi:MAG: FecR family protein [Sphingobacterium thalpophilum]|jgi:ferric-dicitrate binding protein FerR (iron transport regulator)
MQKEEVQKLVEKYLHNAASAEETEKLFQWYRAEMKTDSEWNFDEQEDENKLKSFIFSRIELADTTDNRFIGTRKYYSLAAAASAVIFLISGLYFLHKSDDVKTDINPVKVATKPAVNDIQPGGIKAILTLSDGKKIVLDDSQNGVVLNQGGIKIHKNSQGVIEYTLIESANEQSINERKEVQTVYNTIQTPVGGKFQLNLADGSKVWLNSASSLRFPVFFAGDTREVELKGEAYFEVSKNVDKKFSVRSGNQTVEVLGTHFNINAYSDEPSITTTLIEGAVRVIELNSKKSQILKPGEQSKVDREIRIQRKDTQAEVAWKDGYFYFENASIETVMRQLGRWYGITARYEPELPEHHFEGAIATNLTLLEVLEILQKSNIHFRLEGKEVIVMP